MNNVMKEQIRRVFEDLEKAKTGGLWFSGIKYIGERKKWFYNGVLKEHCVYKDFHVHEYRDWYDNGQLRTFCVYEKGVNFPVEYRRWNENGELVKDYLE